MKKRYFFLTTLAVLTMSLTACGNTPAKESKEPKVQSKDSGPVKKVNITSINLGNSSGKAYITVNGTQENYTEENFKWAWGLKDSNGTFDDGKATPLATDFVAVPFNATTGAFTVKYCLTDITTIKAGSIYRIYGGTPESYDDIPFESNMFSANDGTRNYYLRQDLDNSLTFDNVQPINWTKASVVEVAEADLPTGVTVAGAYVKFGGTNSKNLTMDTINAWHEAHNIAGNFQRTVGGDYFIHDHVDSERFWTIEGNEVYFYLYVGFIAEGEGWMTHFDVVSGNENAGLSMGVTLNGSPKYHIGEAMYMLYADTSKSGEENYWGCLGVYRAAVS